MRLYLAQPSTGEPPIEVRAKQMKRAVRELPPGVTPEYSVACSVIAALLRRDMDFSVVLILPEEVPFIQGLPCVPYEAPAHPQEVFSTD